MNLDLGNVLKKTVDAESEAFKTKKSKTDKFANADKVLNGEDSPKIQKEAANKKSSAKRQTDLKRDSFLFPPNEHALIKAIQDRVMKSGHYLNKNEVIRLGLLLLSKMESDQLVEAAKTLPQVVRGRPSDDK